MGRNETPPLVCNNEEFPVNGRVLSTRLGIKACPSVWVRRKKWVQQGVDYVIKIELPKVGRSMLTPMLTATAAEKLICKAYSAPEQEKNLLISEIHTEVRAERHKAPRENPAPIDVSVQASGEEGQGGLRTDASSASWNTLINELKAEILRDIRNEMTEVRSEIKKVSREIEVLQGQDSVLSKSIPGMLASLRGLVDHALDIAERPDEGVEEGTACGPDIKKEMARVRAISESIPANSVPVVDMWTNQTV